MKKYSWFSLVLMCLLCVSSFASTPTFQTTAGYIAAPGHGRDVFNFNVGWRFFQGDIENAASPTLNDNAWEVVALPHTVALMAAEASGCRNYQGPAWYRKRVTFDPELQGRRLFLYFEAIMGKSQIYVDGQLVKEHEGGYLPIIIDLQAAGVKPGQSVLIAVRTDNSDDGTYPPGKNQNVLDFTYAGGIYRDCYLIATSNVYITDPNFVDKTAGGGVFLHYENISETSATLVVETDIQNDGNSSRTVSLTSDLQLDSVSVQKITHKITIAAGASQKVTQRITVKNPKLWSPETPVLYRLVSSITDKKVAVDYMSTPTGIRSVEFKGADGLYLNGKPYQDKLMGANRHQDYAYIGNAMPNNLSWRDAVILRTAGCKIVRSAHYPQDPSFMDACDALGLFVIVATPGWQYWNNQPSFAEYVYSDIRNMVRRDRNHTSVIMWEPILNETRYTSDFAQNTYNITHEEYPYPGCYCAADENSSGVRDLYDVLYSHPMSENAYQRVRQSVFTREWGDFVDNWVAHNSLSRVSRSWGESPMLIQSMHYANEHHATDYDLLYKTPRQHVGGALWHPFDHQRGYHPDPFWGGFTDAFRQPKYSYYMFKSQQKSDYVHPSPLIQTGPMIYIAHEATPFSGSDVTVFTNCDSVRLILYSRDTLIQAVNRTDYAMPNAPVIFKDAYSFLDLKTINRGGTAYHMVAEGIINGQVVATAKSKPSTRSYRVALEIADAGIPFQANGSDIITVIASITDEQGAVRRLAKEQIVFTVEGEGTLIGDETILANPRAVEFGTAPALIRSTLQAGKITVKAHVQFEGTLAPTPAEITFESTPASLPMVYDPAYLIAQNGSNRNASRTSATDAVSGTSASSRPARQTQQLSDEEKKRMLESVGVDQDYFGEEQNRK